MSKNPTIHSESAPTYTFLHRGHAVTETNTKVKIERQRERVYITGARSNRVEVLLILSVSLILGRVMDWL